MNLQKTSYSKNLPWNKWNGFCKLDIVAILLAFGFCFFTMYYADIAVTARFSLTFIDSLFDGKPISFYGNALVTGIAPEGAVYDIGMYILFAVWNLPVWILNKLFGINLMSVGCLLWYKLLLLVFMFISADCIGKIGHLMGYDDITQNSVKLYYLLSFTLIFPVFVAVQYDILPLTFILYGTLFCLKGNKRKFILFFAIAMTMKPFALFAFVILILLTEKRILKIIVNGLSGVSLLLCCKIIYSFSEEYRMSGGDFLSGMLPKLFSKSVSIGNAELSLFMLVLFLICIGAYNWNIGNNQQENSRKMVLMVSCVWAAFSLLVDILPYWLVYFAPFLILCVFMNPRKVNFCLILDWFYNISVTIIMIMKYTWVYGGEKTFQYLFFKSACYNFIGEKEGVTVAGIFRKLYLEDLLPVFSALQVAAVAAILIIAWRTKMQEREKAGIWHVRLRICMVYGWIAISMGAFILGILGY